MYIEKVINIIISMKTNLIRIAFFFLSLICYSAAEAQYGTYGKLQEVETGIAMYYADYLHGQSTALGEIYNKLDLTCSHEYYPKGTLLKVTRLDNSKSVTVRVNDRGDFDNGVIIDLSWAAADLLDMIKIGKANVTVEKAGYSNLNPVNPNREKYLSQNIVSFDAPSQAQVKETLTPKTGNLDNYYNDYYKSSYNYGNVDYSTTNNKQTLSPSLYDRFTPKTPYPSEKKVATTTTAPNSGYGIQVGSYSVYDNADRQAESLRTSGVSNIYIKEAYTNGRTLYKVVVATFSSRQDAQDYLARLRSSAIADGIVIDLSR